MREANGLMKLVDSETFEKEYERLEAEGATNLNDPSLWDFDA